MKFILAISIIMLLSVNVQAYDPALRELIQKNIQDSIENYEKIISPIQKQSKTIKLWINVPTENQRRLGRAIFTRLADTASEGSPIERNPIQIVGSVNQENQLRYFKKKDEALAAELSAKLKEFIPDITLKDFSDEYANIDWIKSGHLELWLSPTLQNIEGLSSDDQSEPPEGMRPPPPPGG